MEQGEKREWGGEGERLIDYLKNGSCDCKGASPKFAGWASIFDTQRRVVV